MNRLLFLALLAVVVSTTAAQDGDLVTAGSAEHKVIAAIQSPNISVVHLWAPWCSNCQAELKSGGWAQTIKDYPNAHFYFVSIWNGGDDGRAVLQKFQVADQPNVTVLSDPGPRTGNKITRF